MKANYMILRGGCSLAIIAGAIGGLTYTIFQILENRYVQHGLYRLVFLKLQESLNMSMLLALGLCYLFLVIFVCIQLSTNLMHRLRIDCGHNPDGLNTILACIPSAVLLGAGLWLLKSDYLAFRSIAGLITSHAVLLVCVALSGWIVFRFKASWIRKTLSSKGLVLCGAVAVLCVVVINAGLLLDKSVNSPCDPNIIIVVIDALRADHLKCYGYSRDTSPAIDRLAEHGVLFRNAFSNASWTKPAVATLMTSLYLPVHRTYNASDSLDESVVTLAEILRNSGCRASFFNGGNANFDKNFNLTQGFDFYFFGNFFETCGRDITESFLARHVLTSSSRGKFFAYIHYMDTHGPYNVNQYNTLFTEKINPVLRPGTWDIGQAKIRPMLEKNTLSAEAAQYIVDLYDGQIRLVDDNVEHIITALRDRVMLGNTIVIVTSDHGEEFVDHGNWAHGHTLYDEVIRVPLTFAGNNIRPAIVQGSVGLVDIVPTLLEIAGVVTNTFGLQGGSLLPAWDGSDAELSRRVFATGTRVGDEKFCVIDADARLIMGDTTLQVSI